jgi:rSAM/selenodomain-associated transferase 1
MARPARSRVSSRSVKLIVIAKEPVAGRVKTRLSPQLTAREAASVAAAALGDTLAAVAAVDAPRRVIALEGEPGPWVPPGLDVIAQAEGGLDERLAAAFAAVGGPALLVGMDTPQLTPSLLAAAAERLLEPKTDAVLGPAEDGGYWAIGLRSARRDAFEGVPMSSPRTGRAQMRRLAALGLRVRELPELRDVDTVADALAVARLVPRSRFAAAFEGTPAMAASGP